jgi:hypothetical protein
VPEPPAASSPAARNGVTCRGTRPAPASLAGGHPLDGLIDVERAGPGPRVPGRRWVELMPTGR